MWKLKESAEGKSKRENAELVKEMLEGLKQKIPQIQQIEVGINFREDKQAFDMVLYSKFNNEEDLQSYINHPEHKKISEFISKVRSERIFVDYKN